LSIRPKKEARRNLPHKPFLLRLKQCDDADVCAATGGVVRLIMGLDYRMLLKMVMTKH
jgi:hypothetical protein